MICLDIAFGSLGCPGSKVRLYLEDNKACLCLCLQLLACVWRCLHQQSELCASADGEIHVALKAGKPYSMWNIVSLAHHATQGRLTLKTKRLFEADCFPGECSWQSFMAMLANCNHIEQK